MRGSDEVEKVNAYKVSNIRGKILSCRLLFMKIYTLSVCQKKKKRKGEKKKKTFLLKKRESFCLVMLVLNNRKQQRNMDEKVRENFEKLSSHEDVKVKVERILFHKHCSIFPTRNLISIITL